MTFPKQNDVVFPEVPTLETSGVRDPEMRETLESHFPTVYGQYHTYLKSWQSFLRFQPLLAPSRVGHPRAVRLCRSSWAAA